MIRLLVGFFGRGEVVQEKVQVRGVGWHGMGMAWGLSYRHRSRSQLQQHAGLARVSLVFSSCVRLFRSLRDGRWVPTAPVSRTCSANETSKSTPGHLTARSASSLTAEGGHAMAAAESIHAILHPWNFIDKSNNPMLLYLI